ncbi:C2H2-type domain-containing protein [Mycena indigotica]|uniref:C2H2-type domain-containing protein n=1 Tax=Mycena indigotica TaxID=2126181 RepID=A0A8H6WE66_9AGAR|nr:C2H2-type domain-containing protein [Mycena indigotica]KAF7315404.1 C2H2-type domain-containing protein [Mycena indigotica]
MYHSYKSIEDRPTLPSIGRIFDGAPVAAVAAPVYRRPSLTLPPLDNGLSWEMQTRQYAYPPQPQPQPNDYYRMPSYMSDSYIMDRLSPESDPGRDTMSSTSSYSSTSSHYDATRMPYRPSSAPQLGPYRTTPSYHQTVPQNPFYATRPPSSSAAARHQCPYCNKRFNRPSGLKIHLTVHTNDKPYICPEESCGRAFSVRSNMRRHVRIVHQLTREGSGEPNPASE